VAAVEKGRRRRRRCLRSSLGWEELIVKKRQGALRFGPFFRRVFRVFEKASDLLFKPIT
jgi:hypothetical protein